MQKPHLNDTALELLRSNYLQKNAVGEVVETAESMFCRVADAVAAIDRNYSADADIDDIYHTFYDMMAELRFLPCLQTLVGAGKPYASLSSRITLPVIGSVEGVFDSIKISSIIKESGAEYSLSLSGLAKSNSRTAGSSPMGFMKLLNSGNELLLDEPSVGKGNCSLRIDHPDILDFIASSKNKSEAFGFGLIVGITDAFLKAVGSDSEYELISPLTGKAVGSLSARTVFGKLVDSVWHCGEPKLVFIDRCEQESFAAGISGAINLSGMVVFSDDGECDIDTDVLKKTVVDAVHFLDNIIDLNTYPCEAVAAAVMQKRTVSLGVMGFADMLLRMNIAYDSPQALSIAQKVMDFITLTAHEASEDLAATRGAFPLFPQSPIVNGKLIRNAGLTAIYPTGFLSVIAGCSPGIEPVFSYAYHRITGDGNSKIELNAVLEQRLREKGQYSEQLLESIADLDSLSVSSVLSDELKSVFRTVRDISPEQQLKMQSAFQKHTDGIVSRTVSFSQDASREQIAESFLLAAKLNCNCVCVYRDGSLNELSDELQANEPSDEKEKPSSNQSESYETPVFNSIRPRERPDVTKGFTERVLTCCGNLYITVNFDDNGICEVFTSTGKAGGCPSQSEATSRLASIALRSGISVEEICAQLKGIRCPTTVKSHGTLSCPDAIARAIEKIAGFHERHSKRAESIAESVDESTAENAVTTPAKSSVFEPADEPLKDEPELTAEQKIERFIERHKKQTIKPYIPSYRLERFKNMNETISRFSGKTEEPKEEPVDIESTPIDERCPECGCVLEREGEFITCKDCGYSRCG